MPIVRSTAQQLDEVVGDWNESVQSKSFRVPDGVYICDLQSAGIEKAKDSFMSVLLFVVTSPTPGRQIRLTNFLTSNKGSNDGIWRTLDEVDAVRESMNLGPVDRKKIVEGRGKALEKLLTELTESRPTDIKVVARTTDEKLSPEKLEAGAIPRKFQNFHVDPSATTELEPSSEEYSSTAKTSSSKSKKNR